VDFRHPTYVILPIQPPIADHVLALRERFGYTLAYPVEVTVAGSSGLGVLEPDQDPAGVLEVLRTIASEVGSFVTSYGEVRRFPNTNIFWLSLKNEEPFRTIHQRLKESGVRFTPNPFPYQPHCTLQVRPRTEEETVELLSLQVPGEIRFAELALASVVERENGEFECPMVWRARLTGTPLGVLRPVT
jgi:hypothetical protein